MNNDKLIIKLTCEVGSTVYLHINVKSGKRTEVKILSGQIDRYVIGALGIPFAEICCENDEWYYFCSYPGDFFLTYEEAQTALNKNNN